MAKLNPTGSMLVYSTYLSGSGQDEGISIAVDGSGSAYVTGNAGSTDFPTVNALQPAFGGSNVLGDAFVAKLNAVDSATTDPGETVTVSTAPQMEGESGVSATLTNNTAGSGEATVTVETLPSNPTTVNVFDIGGGFVDVRVTSADSTDSVAANFYYPSTVTGVMEDKLDLLYFTGSAWEPVLSSGGIAPVKDTTDNLDGTISGGRFSVTFDNTSTPTITGLTGTEFTFTIPQFNFNGFFQPVDTPPTINVANAGSTVPVKFSLNGDQGLDIFEAGYPKSQVITCDTTSPLDALEETSTAGSSSLSYDPSTDQYIYVWKTNNIWANTCRQLAVKLNDGSSHIANFKFKK